MTIEDLAMITQQGFIGMEQRMDKRFEKLESDVLSIKEDVSSLKEDVSSLKEDVSSLKEGQKETNRRLASLERKQMGTLLSLDETITRKEFESVVHRVEILEKQ